MKPIIQYDRLMGVQPEWRKAITEALQGHPALVERTYLSLMGWSPSAAHMLEAAYHYALCGQQVYCLGPRLLEMLQQTATTHIPAEAIKIPYECFYIAFQDAPWKIWGDRVTRLHQVAGAYVFQRSETQVTVLLWGAENKRSRVAGDDASFWVDLYLGRISENPDRLGTLNLDTYLKKVFSNQSLDASDPGLEVPRFYRKKQLDAVIGVIQVIFNMMLYVTSLDADLKRQAPNKTARDNLKRKIAKTKKPKAKRKLQEQLRQHTEASVIWIGKDIEKETIPETAPSKKTGGGGGGTWTYRKGHFHNYWTGPRKDAEGNPQFGTKKVLKWVKPQSRDMVSVIASRGRHHKFREDKGTS